MKKVLLVMLLLSSTAFAGDFVIGFRGQGNAFDHKAFQEFARKRNLEPIEFGSYEAEKAFRYINSRKDGYELYGFSAGAWTVKQVLALQHMNHGRMPMHVTTVGAHPSVNVDFSQWGVPFTNYFDNSGKNHKSPGTHMPVPHSKAMESANKF